MLEKGILYLQQQNKNIYCRSHEKNIYIKCDLRRTDKDKAVCSSLYFSLNMENTRYTEFTKGLVLSALFIHTFLVHFRRGLYRTQAIKMKCMAVQLCTKETRLNQQT